MSNLAYSKMATGTSIANPLNLKFLGKSSGNDNTNTTFTSESRAMVNDNPSVCPKCKNPMITATISSADVKAGISTSSSDEQVYFCISCRVTHPLKD
jgi:uncharacterized protein with PIN domain